MFLSLLPTLVFVWTEIDLLHTLDIVPGILEDGGSQQDVGEQEWEYDNGAVKYRNPVCRLTLLDDGNYHDFEVDRVVPPTINALGHAEEKQLPLIVWWTPYSANHGKIKRCWSGDCFFTENQTFYAHALTKAFLFYGTNINFDDLPLPRKENHEWGLLHEESPANDAIFQYKETLELFNHTATFKQESTYPLSTQFINSISYLLKPAKYTVHEKEEMKLKYKMASVAYIQSHCNPPSDRDVYVKELMRYIKIDSYGKCLHNKDLASNYNDSYSLFDEGFTELLQKYKFVVSFENAICNDYMTEKLYRTLSLGVIPIYKGAPNVGDWLPNNYSVILVDDFKTPKELAEYIIYVDQDPYVYEKYIEYKRSGIRNAFLRQTLDRRQWGVGSGYDMDYIVGFECHVCDQIHQNIKLVSAGELPIKHEATGDHYKCPLPSKYNFSSTSAFDEEQRGLWTWEYERAGKRIDRLRKLLLASK